MNLDETADFISEGLTETQRLANRNFLEGIHATLNLGGMWGYPGAMQIFKKTEDGFELVLDCNDVFVEQ